MRTWMLGAWMAFAACAALAQPAGAWRAASPQEQAQDAQAFAGLAQDIAARFGDVQSVVVVQRGRTAFEYHRNGNAETLHDTQSVAKSALAALVGVALHKGHIRSLDAPVVELVPAWRTLNADARAQAITLRHLLAMTAGFEVHDLVGTAAPLAPPQAWARPLRAAPGQAFAYDNSIVPMVSAILEAATGKPLADYAREHLVQPLGMAAPDYTRGLRLRTADMARIGHLFVADGLWDGQRLLAPGFVAEATRAHSRGGPPVQLPYGLFWWAPSASTYFASGYAGQFIWVHPPLGLVVAVTSTVSQDSQRRGPLFQAAEARQAAGR